MKGSKQKAEIFDAIFTFGSAPYAVKTGFD